MRTPTSLLILAAITAAGPRALASSHAEAPFVKEVPKADATDFYMFRSYEPGREGFVTIVANYYPLQDPYGGPNYFPLDSDALYEIKIDNNGDAREDLTFSFRLGTVNRNISLNIGGKSVPVPLYNVGMLGPAAGDNGPLNVLETYTARVIRCDDDRPRFITNAATGEPIFRKPADNVGTKSIPNYPAYAANHIYTVRLPAPAPPAACSSASGKTPSS